MPVKDLNYGLQMVLKIIYITGAIVGLIFALAVLLAGIQKALVYRRQCRHRRQSQSQQPAESQRPIQNQPACGTGNVIANKTTGPSSFLPPPTYRQSVRAPVVLPPAAEQSSSDSLLPCGDGEAPPSYDEVLREEQNNQPEEV